MRIANEMENDPTLGAGNEPTNTGLVEVSEQLRAKAAAKKQQPSDWGKRRSGKTGRATTWAERWSSQRRTGSQIGISRAR